MRRAEAATIRAGLAALVAVVFCLLGEAGPQPAALAQSSGIQIAGATAISPIVLSRGCNQVVATSPAGTPVAAIAALVQPANAVVAIWRFSNTAQTYQAGFFAGSGAPVDFTRTGGQGQLQAGRVTEAYFVCVSQSATMLST